jgi:hypothetical protein
MKALSLAIVGIDYPNKRGPARRFELEICQPGEPIELRSEPNNPHDEHAIAVFSCRGIQLGYLASCGDRATRRPLSSKRLSPRWAGCALRSTVKSRHFRPHDQTNRHLGRTAFGPILSTTTNKYRVRPTYGLTE